MDKIFDFGHPFFVPIWRRYAVVTVCFAMAGLEIWNEMFVWASIFAAMGGVACWRLFFDEETKAKLDDLARNDAELDKQEDK